MREGLGLAAWSGPKPLVRMAVPVVHIDKLQVPEPSSLEDQDSSIPIPPGQDYLLGLLHRFVARSAEADVAALQSWLASTVRGSLTVGTICSGSDSPLLCFEALGSIAETDWGIAFRISHEFACEHAESKAAFLQELWPDYKNIFRDAESMGLPGNFDFRSQRPKDVPKVQVLLAGFPCTDSSRLNAKSATQESSGKPKSQQRTVSRNQVVQVRRRQHPAAAGAVRSWVSSSLQQSPGEQNLHRAWRPQRRRRLRRHNPALQKTRQWKHMPHF